jgi:glycosyltransferase involved in cell wall biosynthesis
MKEELEEKGFDPDLMTIWPRGINLDIFNPGQRDEAFIRHLVGDGRMNILFASRLVWEKNLETLIDIYQMIEEQNLEYNLIIAGDGMAREELEAQMPKAHFTGHLNHVELSKLYASTDYFLFTSVTETYGNVVTEAMACGAACLVADGGGSQSLIKEGINGFLCKPYSARDYLYKIQLLEDHPEFKKRMKKQAIKDMQNLKWGHIVAALFKEMEDLIRDSDDHKKSKKPRISRASLPFLLDEWSSDFFYQRCTA